MVTDSFQHEGIGARTPTPISVNGNYMCESPTPNAWRPESLKAVLKSVFVLLFRYGETETKVGVFNIFKLSRDGLHLKQPAPRVLFIPIEHSVSRDDLFRAKS